MKKVKALCVLMTVLLLTSCSGGEKERWDREDFVYCTAREDCFLCSEVPPFDSFWGQDSIGIVSVNTFELVPLEMTPRGGGYVSVQVPRINGLPMSVYTLPDMGIADVSIDGEAGIAEPERVGEFICGECLDKYKGSFSPNGAPTEIGIVDFSTRELVAVGWSDGWFTIGDFVAECDFDPDGGMDIFLCTVSGR